MWKSALLALILINVIIILLPVFRDYFIMGRGDVLSHIGYAKDLISSGNFQGSGGIGENLYPLLHITMASFYYISGISLYLQTQILPLFYYLFFIFSLYLLSNEITNNRANTILIMAFGSIIPFQFETTMLAPSVEGFYLIPFVIYLFYKTRNSNINIIEYTLLLILFLVLIPFFHSGEVTLFLLIIFVLIYISARFYQRYTNNKLESKLGKPFFKNNSSIFLLLMVIWLTWFTSFSWFFEKAQQVISWFKNEIGSSNLMQFSSLLSLANLSLDNLILIAMSLYGQYILFLTAAMVVSIIFLRGFFSAEKDDLNISHLNILTYVFLFIIFAAIGLISFINVVGVEFTRVLKYVMLIAILLNGLFFYSYFQAKPRIKNVGMIFLVGLILSGGIIGLFNIYASPITKGPNFQTTDMELTGQSWFLNYRNPDLIIDNNINFYYGQILRLNDAIKGVKFNINNKTTILTGPDHFNYQDKTFYGETYDTSWYYIDMTLLRIAYPELYPGYENKWRYTPADYNKFDKLDKSVNNIYSNGDYRVYLIL
ncbi:MAG: hypothetical protein LLF83_07425 [Methanobacterium sp.]|nr:hypothetical protein [Methanobacterium sp.]